MKKSMLALFILAAGCLLIAVLEKLNILPWLFLGNLPHVYVWIAQLLLLAAIGLGIYGLLDKK
ncbi:hypothetical protein HY768_08700 [candidate division TA06 bacterium]|uniref:Uncharacterized protein n=1 Tax=candidate division TA06 bacterium TaxID=2250710 RepID=A0A933MLA6_UNCT6|nr:hypothetical protein [candidate division TA06 bacterium]